MRNILLTFQSRVGYLPANIMSNKEPDEHTRWYKQSVCLNMLLDKCDFPAQ